MKKVILTRLAAIGVCMLAAPMISGQDTQQRIKDTKQAVSDYVYLRQQIAETKNEWRVYEEVTTRRIEFFQEEIERLQREIAQTENTRSSAQQVIEERRQEIDRLQAANDFVNQSMPALESAVAALGQYFPPPLRNRVAPLMDQLGTPRQAAQRMAIVIGVLNEVDRFNADWTDASSQVGTSLVNVLYMGMAGGFYANSEGTIGGYLVPSEGQWEQVEDNSIAPQVAAAIRFFRGQVRPAELVPLPVQVQEFAIGQ